MNRKIKFFAAALLALSLSTSVLADELEDAKNKLNNSSNNLNENKEKLQQIQKDKDSVENQIKSLDSKMDATAEELDNIRALIDSANNEITTIGSEIEKRQKSIETEKGLLDKRVSAMYKNGAASYLNIIIGAKNLTDMFDRIVVLKKVIDYDKKLIGNLQSDKAALEVKKADAEKKKADMALIKENQNTKLDELKNQSEDKRNLMTSLEKDRVVYQKLVDEEEAEAKALKDKIKNLETSLKSKNKNGKLFCVTGRAYAITSPYGWRVHPVLQTKRFHYGIDIGVYSGTPIYSLMDGVVVYSGTMSGYGKVVMVNHGELTSLYAHNSSIAVKEGQTVKGGQLISYSGNTGLSSGPHLHFEIRKSNGDTIDPLPYYVR